MSYYVKTVEQTLTELDASENGLSRTDALERQKIYGLNMLNVSGEPLWRKLIEPFANVFMIVLLIAAAISILKNEKLDAVIILMTMAISVTIYYVQRFSTERVLRTLRKQNNDSVEVLRENKLTRLDASQLVPGDVVFLDEGDKIPADARLLTVDSLQIDESQLTGESVPIEKSPDVLQDEKEIYEQRNMVFQGSFVVSGRASAIVVATGNATEFGRLALLTQGASDVSPVQLKIDRLIARLIAVIAVIATVVFGLAVLRGMELSEALRFATALSVSAVPEGLPVAITVILVLGMRRMAAKKALVRNMGAIESLGAITVIATDKTGTLTKNEPRIAEVWQLHPNRPKLLDVMVKAVNRRDERLHDPLDHAMNDYATKDGARHPSHAPLRILPFDQLAAMSGNLWHHGKEYTLTIKGAPEHVIERSDLTEGEREQAEKALAHLTGQGYRVIAIGEMKLTHPIEKFSDLKRADKLNFVGFLAVADTIRHEVKRAITLAQEAGIKVCMVTGDHRETAFHIGKELGLAHHRSEVFDTRRMSVMSDEELEAMMDKISVFSRVIPEHKYRILDLLKKKNITAMTGDGVNDVPALTNAHVGIAMGSGTSIAKDAGDMVLLNNNFRSIVSAIHEGRIIYANLRRMLLYLLSTSTGEVLTMLGALTIGVPLPLLPVQLLWVNLITDTLLVIPLGLEPGEAHIMKQKPFPPAAPILTRYMLTRIAIVAITMATTTLGIYNLFADFGHAYAQTLAFLALVIMQWTSALATRSDYLSVLKQLTVINWKFYGSLAIAILIQVLVMFGPLGQFLHVIEVSRSDMILTAIIAMLAPLVVIELHKFIARLTRDKQEKIPRVSLPSEA